MSFCEPVIYVVDDDSDVRESLVSLLGAMGRKVKAFSSAKEFLDSCDFSGSGCIILDIRMPEMSGLNLQNKLCENNCSLPIIFITGHGDVNSATEAFKKGAVDFIEKPFSEQQLLDSIDKAVEKSVSEFSHNMQIEKIKERIESLTDREKQIMEKIVNAKTNKMIAYELGLSHKTVDFHRSNIMEKMGVNCVVQLTKEVLKVTDR